MFIEREKNTGAIFDYSKYYNFSEIIFKKSNFEKIYITNYYFKKLKLLQNTTEGKLFKQ